MKKIILTIVVIALMTFISNAQDKENNIRLGVKAGINSSNVYDAQGEDFTADSKIGFVGGAFLSIPIGKYLGFQPEVLFSQKGFKAEGTLLGNGYELTRTSNFVDIPLLLAVRPAEFVTLLAGPQFSYLLSQKDVFSNSVASSAQEQEFKNDNIRKNILCFVGGVDLNFEPVVVGLRGGWDVQRNNGDGSSTTPRYKNVWFQGTVGLRF
jgi:hypothetical protein